MIPVWHFYHDTLDCIYTFWFLFCTHTSIMRLFFIPINLIWWPSWFVGYLDFSFVSNTFFKCCTGVHFRESFFCVDCKIWIRSKSRKTCEKGLCFKNKRYALSAIFYQEKVLNNNKNKTSKNNQRVQDER